MLDTKMDQSPSNITQRRLKKSTSRNFHFLSNLEPQESTTDDDLVLTPNVLREGKNGQEDE